LRRRKIIFAGFWLRFVAYIIDAILIGVVNFIVLIPFLGMIGLSSAMDNPEAAEGMMIAAMGTYFMSMFVMFIAGWLYFALMESSNKGATLGKMALSLRVTGMNGEKISFGKATGRYFGKIISGMILCIGYIMAGFTEKKQALHDMMAGCLVVRK
jgi:uncharacterized RDD family membrane protein YckC